MSGKLIRNQTCRAGELRTRPSRTGDRDVNMVCGPKITPRVKSQPVTFVLGRDVLKEVLIGRDAQRRRSAPPFNVKSTVRLDLCKIRDRPCVRNNVSVVDDAANVTAGNAEQTGKKCDAKLFHGVVFTNEMKPARVLDSTISLAAPSRSFGDLEFDRLRRLFINE